MARMHVLRSSGPNTYQIILHHATPGGQNSAGIAWSTAIMNSGRAFTRMVEGSGAGQISAAEKATVINGTVIESSFNFTIDPTWTAAERNAALDAEANKLEAEVLAELAQQLAWFGATRGT